MNNIYIVGDMHTVSAFRLAGVRGVVSEVEQAHAQFEEIVNRDDAGIVIITNRLAEALREKLAELSFSGSGPVIIEIPGIDDEGGLRASAVRYIAGALGISL